mmetsp:Transcript_33507/g.53756  ORF Transcript_33507/g.53756 Transcript_33507/m.53756 type:complete len:101 (-) Transcript_33507:365-667(-)
MKQYISVNIPHCLVVDNKHYIRSLWRSNKLTVVQFLSSAAPLDATTPFVSLYVRSRCFHRILARLSCAIVAATHATASVACVTKYASVIAKKKLALATRL